MGGGMYVPILMQDMNIGITKKQEARIMEMWGGNKPEVSEELGAGNGGQFWDSPAGYFTVGVPMLMTERKEVVHNVYRWSGTHWNHWRSHRGWAS